MKKSKPKDKPPLDEDSLESAFCKACKEEVLNPHDCPSSGSAVAVHRTRHMDLGA